MRNIIRVKIWLTIFALLVGAFHQSTLQAQALPVAPVANFVVNRTIGHLITNAGRFRGFAANDPRIAATLQAVESQVTAVNAIATVGSIAVAVAGAPVWLSALAGLGVFAAGSFLIYGSANMAVTNIQTVNGSMVQW